MRSNLLTDKKTITLLKIEAIYHKLAAAEKRLLDYIINNEKDIIYLTITELAENTGVSPATVIRACKKMGYRGFQDFKITVAQEIMDPIKSIVEEAEESDSPFDILNKEIGSIVETLKMTRKVIDKDELTKATELILNARKVVVYGCGNSAAIADDTAHKLVRVGIDGVSYSDSHKQIIISATLTEDDVAIGISHSGSSKDIVEALEVAKESGSKTICITNYGRSPIVKVSDVKLFTASPETKYRIIGLSSRIAQLAIVDSIYIYVALRNKGKAVSTIKRIEKALQSKKY